MEPDLGQGLNNARKEMLTKISEYFSTRAVEGHVFGSLGNGTDDALSDIDIWLTFPDEEIQRVIDERFEIYGHFGTVLLIHEAQQNSPLNGNYSLVIYETSSGLLQVDYYFSPTTTSRIGSDSLILFEKVPIERGEMIYDSKRIKKGPDDRVSFLICMCFVGIKKIARKDEAFMDFLVKEYTALRENSFPKLGQITNLGSFETLRTVLTNLSEVSNMEQKHAIQKILDFSSKISE